MTKIILHNGRCGSTYIYLVLDRYYRARYGDDSEGDFNSIYERLYDFNVEKYVGLHEYLVPEIVEQIYYNDALWVWSPSRTEAIKKVKGWDLDKKIQASFHSSKDNHEKRSRRMLVTSLLETHDVVLKYPMLTNPKPVWDVDYISCERRDVRKQTKSLMTSMITGRFHFAPGEEKKRDRLKKFGPRPGLLDAWTKDVERSWQVYRAMKPKRCQTLFMEDFENLKPFEVLELIGIMDWNKYLDKGFDVPVRKGWHA